MSIPKYAIGQTVKTPEGTGTVESITITAAGINYTVKEPIPTQFRVLTHPETLVTEVPAPAAPATPTPAA